MEEDEDGFVYEDFNSDTPEVKAQAIPEEEPKPVEAEPVKAEEPVEVSEPLSAETPKPQTDADGFVYEDFSTPDAGYYVRPDRNKKEEEVSWSDTGNSALGAAYDLLGGYGATVRRVGENIADPKATQGNLGEELGKYIQFWANGKSDEAREAMSPQAQRIMQASVTDPDFWNTDNLWLQGAAQTPHILSSVIAAAIMKTPKAAYAMEAANADAMMTNDLYRKLDSLTDAQLQSVVINGQSPYAEARKNGMTEKQARREFAKTAIGWRPELLGGVTAALGAIDPSGIAARKLVGGVVKEGVEQAVDAVVEKGITRRVAETGALAGVSEGIQGATEAGLTQQSEIASGLRKEYDPSSILVQGLTEATVGGALGGALGVFPDAKPKKLTPYEMPPADPDPIIDPTETTLPDQPMAEPVAKVSSANKAEAAKAVPGVPTVTTPEKVSTKTTPEAVSTTDVVPVVPQPVVNVAAVDPAAITAIEGKPVVNPNVKKRVTAARQKLAPVEPVVAPPVVEPAVEPAADPTLQSNQPVVAEQPVVPAVEPQPIPKTAEVAQGEALAPTGDQVTEQPLETSPAPASLPEPAVSPVSDPLSEARDLGANSAYLVKPPAGKLTKKAKAAFDEKQRPLRLKEFQRVRAMSPEQQTAYRQARSDAEKAQARAEEVGAAPIPGATSPAVEESDRLHVPTADEIAELEAKIAKINAERAATNINLMNRPEEDIDQTLGKNDKENRLQKKGKAKVAERAKTIEAAQTVATSHLPDGDAENDVYITGKSAKTLARINVAQKMVSGRVAKMMAALDKAGAVLPKLYKNTGNKDEQFSIETLLMMEAKALHDKVKAGKANSEDYRRFKRQEYFAILGDLDAMLEARRTEGNRQKSSDSNAAAKGNLEDVLEQSFAPGQSDGPLDKSNDEDTRGKASEQVAAPVYAEDEVAPESVSVTPKEELEAEERKEQEAAAQRREAAKQTGYEPVAAKTPATLVVQRKRVISKPSLTPASEAVRKLAEARAKASLQATKSLVGITSQGKRIGMEADEPSFAEQQKETVDQIKRDMEQAREDTNTNPSAAQVAAGNYAKGRVNVNGVNIAIETPKGAIRSNKDPAGPHWEVKMKHDYGEIERTKGNDGDPIDVLVGPNHDSPYVFVVDQIDLGMKLFDEHKALMSFSNLTEAMRGYDSMFSDNSSAARAGEVSQMTLDEFKQWLKLSRSERRQMSRQMQAQHAQDRQREFADAERREQRDINAGYVETMSDSEIADYVADNNAVPDGYLWHGNVQRGARIIRQTTVRQHLGDLDVSSLPRGSLAFARIMKAHLVKLVGDIEILVLNPEDTARLYGAGPGKTALGWYDTGGRHIVLNSAIFDNPQKKIETVIHEAVHAATSHAIDNDPIFMMEINGILDYAKSQIKLDLYQYNVRYGFTDAHEFITAALTNPEFQEVLGRMPAPAYMVQRYGLTSEGKTSLWDVLVGAVRKMFSMPKGAHSVLEAMMRVSEEVFAEAEAAADTGGYSLPSVLDDDMMPPNVKRLGMVSEIKEQARSAVDRYILNGPSTAPSISTPWNLRWRGFDSIARAAARLMGRETPVTALNDLIEGQKVTAQKRRDKVAPAIQNLAELAKKYAGKEWDEFAGFLNDEQMAGVFADRPLADQDHISAKGESDIWSREQHPALAARYAKLPADLKKARADAIAYFTAEQNTMAFENIKNHIVALTDTPDPDAMAKRIFNKQETEADKALIGEELYNDIRAAGRYSKVDGPYLPLMRRGKYVVKGRLKITLPSNGVKVNGKDNEFEFKDRAAAGEWAKKQEGRPMLRSFYVDKTTGATHKEVDGQQVRLNEKDDNVEQRTRVNVQNEFMEMVDTLAEAREMVAGLRAKGIDTDDAVARRFESHGLQQDLLSTELKRMNDALVKRAEARGHTPAQIREMVSSLNEMAIGAMGSTRIQTHRLPRRHVKGASKDLVRNLVDYSHSSSNYIAKLQHQPKIDKALKELDALIAANKQSGKANALTEIANEVKKRITTPSPTSEGNFAPITNRLLTLSFVDKLMSPAYSMMDALQPMMTSLPYLASHYGAGRAAMELQRAYRDIGSLRALSEGIGNTARKLNWNNADVPSNPVDVIKGRLKDAGERAFITAMQDVGVIGSDAGFEVDKMVQSSRGLLGKMDKSLGYIEGIARQMPKTIEAMNRTTVGLAAYRMEMKRSGDVAKATQFAKDTINLTQFNYSSSNAAGYMNHPMLRLLLQFKKYGASMYQFLGEQMGVAFSRNATPEQRVQAAKAVAYTIAMHALMAGAMGLPTEPLRLAVTAAHAAGLIELSWADVDDAMRNHAADLFGKDIGEMVTRGLPHAMGIDLSSRLGLDTLMGPFGEPRSDEAQDFKAYLWDAVGGAPAGLLADWGKGINDVAEGDVIRGMERLIPIKVISDSIKAYRTYTEGSVSERTHKQTMSPYSMGEAVTKILGFAPARESESFERSSAFYRAKTNTEEATTEFKRNWLDASGASRGRVWRDIRKWNKGRPKEEQISMGDLRKYQKRIKSELKETKEGIRASKREGAAMKRVEETYNYLP